MLKNASAIPRDVADVPAVLCADNVLLTANTSIGLQTMLDIASNDGQMTKKENGRSYSKRQQAGVETNSLPKRGYRYANMMDSTSHAAIMISIFLITTISIAILAVLVRWPKIMNSIGIVRASNNSHILQKFPYFANHDCNL